MTHSTLALCRSIRSRAGSILLLLLLCAACPWLAKAAAPDPVLEWNAIMNTTVLAGGTNPLVSARVTALVAGSVFDAVNGIDPRYTPLHVRARGPHRASQGAAAVQAAYTMLVTLYPMQLATLTTQRDASIAALQSTESANSIRSGMAWGQSVADSIFTWRSTDGFLPPPPPFLGVFGIDAATTAVGVWRPTPTANLPGAGPQFATMTPWVLTRPSQFRLPPQPALTSPEYTADYNEVQMMGRLTGSQRSTDQTELVFFWNGNAPVIWNRVATQIAATRSLSLEENAHLLALLNVSIADAGIACWDGKYRYVAWRPITAIREGDRDGNADTAAEAAWQPLLDLTSGTPAHPEYPSGHSTVSAAATFVLARMFGNDTPFTVISDVRPETRSFSSFSAALAEVNDARVFGGIHFRTSCVLANALGQEVASYILRHAMRRDDGDRD
jgi:PAP2 superfamily